MTVSVASAAAIAFMKMRSWLDRPAERQKDLQDIAYLLREYVDDVDDRRWQGDVVDLGMDHEDVSPFVVGAELHAILRERHRPHLAEFLDRVTPEKLAGAARWFDAEPAERALDAFKRGLCGA